MDEQALIALEQSLHHPATRSNPAAVAALLADDFREFGASGRVWTRAEILDELDGQAAHEIRSRDFLCQWLAPELALLTYVTETAERVALRSSLWRLEDGAWRIVFHQGTAVR